MASLRARASEWLLRAGRAMRPRNAVAGFEAGGNGRRTRGWIAPRLDPNTAVLNDLQTVRDRSRAGARNNGIAKGVIDKLVSNLIGTGLRPLSQAPDGAFRARVQQLWADWTIESDPEGLLSFYGQQSLAVRAWLEGGEVFVRLRPRLPADGLTVPLQLQILEPELCPIYYNGANRDNGNLIRAGVEYTPIGARAAYWMYRQRPGSLLYMDTTQFIRVPADSVLALYDILRPGQIRGLPHLTQALTRLYDLDQYDDATLLRVKLANMFVGFVKPPTGGADGAGNPLDPVTGKPINLDGDGQAVVSLEAGMFGELRPGEDVTWSDPPDAGPTYPDFMEQQLRAAAVAAGVPYEVLMGDMRKVNDRTVRVILNEFRRRLEQLQAQLVVDRFSRPVWDAWFDRAILAGALEVPRAYFTDPRPWRRAKWQADRWPYIQPVQDIESIEKRIRVGVTSLSAEMMADGHDPEEVFQQIAADNKRMDELGIVLDSDPRKIGRGGQTQGKPVPAGGDIQEPDPNQA